MGTTDEEILALEVLKNLGDSYRKPSVCYKCGKVYYEQWVYFHCQCGTELLIEDRHDNQAGGSTS